MARTISRLFLVFVSVLLLIGCASTGQFNAQNVTDVQLSESNYEVIATSVTGEASAGYILGVSGSPRGRMQTVALARVTGDGMLYGEAVADLWDQFRRKHGETEGRDLALVNVRYDSEALNLLLFTKPTVMVRADVVEFEE
jgi:hypothetical protein